LRQNEAKNEIAKKQRENVPFAFANSSLGMKSFPFIALSDVKLSSVYVALRISSS
jgi:hypothetical protein